MLSIVPHFFGMVFKLFGIKVEVTGFENLDPNKAYLIVCNHQSFLDIPIVIRYIRIVAFLAKIEISKWPLFGYGLRQADCVFVDRKDRRSAKKVGPAMLSKMKEKVSFCVFPEGTRSKKGELLPFKAGIFKIAMESGFEILPAVIVDTWKILPKKSFALTSGTIHLKIMPPVSADKYEKPIELKDKVESIFKESLSFSH